jgi:hypothetical protein
MLGKGADPMALEELRHILNERATNAPFVLADPDELMRRAQKGRRRRITLAAGGGVVVVAVLVVAVSVAANSNSSSKATITPASPSPIESPSATSSPEYCEPPTIAKCEAASPVPETPDRVGYSKQLYARPIRIPITHKGVYSYNVPVTGIRRGFNSFTAGFNLEPKTATVSSVRVFPHDSPGAPTSIDISFNVTALSGASAIVIQNVQVENIS